MRVFARGTGERMEAQRPRLELVVLVGLQASGKSTFYAQRFAASHALVGKDLFRRARRRQERQMRLVREALEAGRCVVVDNTNPGPPEWGPLIAEGRAHGARVRAYWFPPDVEGSLARNARREEAWRVSKVGVFATLGRLRMPHRSDGFDDVHEVVFDGRGGFVTRTVESAGDGNGDPGGEADARHA